jgi:hypothetical protein
LDGSLASFTIELTVTTANDDDFSVTIPGGGTLDLNPTVVSTTPEPASLLLAGAGGAFLLFLRKRKRA